MAGEFKCCCPSGDARQCFLIRHPECRRNQDLEGSLYDEAIDEVCECSCHDDIDLDEYYDSLDMTQ